MVARKRIAWAGVVLGIASLVAIELQSVGSDVNRSAGVTIGVMAASEPSHETGIVAPSMDPELPSALAEERSKHVTPIELPAAMPLGDRSLAGLSGEVRNQRGDAIAGARISAQMLMGAGGTQALLETFSDTSGRFSLEPLEPGVAYRLMAEHPDYAPRAFTGVLPQTGASRSALPVMILFPAARQAGRIVDEQGEPLRGAILEAFAYSGDPPSCDRIPLCTTTSDAQGAFVLEKLPHEMLTFVASMPGRASSSLEGVEVAAAMDEEHVFVLQLAASLEGVVTDVEGRAIPGAVVEAFRQEAGAFASRVTQCCDELGTFLLEDLSAGTYQLKVRAAGFTTRGLGPFQAPGAEPVSLVLERAQCVEGLVTTSSGQPIPDARVALLRPAADSLGVERVDGFEAQSDSTGAFWLPCPYPGVYQVEAQAPGWSSARSGFVVLEPDQAAVMAGVVLTRGATLTARIVDEAGQPIANATVCVLRDDGASSGGGEEQRVEARGASEADGQVRLPGVPEGDVRLIVRAPGHAPGLARSSGLWAGESRALGDIVLEPGAAVVGQVAAVDGSPIAGSEVWLLRMDQDQLPLRRLQALTDPEGRFHLGDLPAGRWMVSASCASGQGASRPDLVDVARGQELVVSLSPGQVRDGVGLTLVPLP